MRFNPILATDSYKLSHAPLYPDNVVGMFSYIEARTGGKDIIVPFGLHMWIMKFLTIPITQEHIDEAMVFATAHGEPFDPKPWQHIIKTYNGYWPVTILAVPEGIPVPSGHALVTIECTDPEVFWVVSYLETALLRGFWYPTTIASRDYAFKLKLAQLYRQSGADMAALPFALHDFGARGVTVGEQAEVGGAAHLVNFMGSDTIEGIRAANYYYSEPMAAFSVPATEHSVECSYGGGSAQEDAYLRKVLDIYAKPGAIVSIVIDGYDWYRAAKSLCTTFKQQIIDSGAKVVFRPDSGNMFEIVEELLYMQSDAFGYDSVFVERDRSELYNPPAYLFKRIRHVGILQGDGIDHQSGIKLIETVVGLGFTADCVVMGSGGGLLQKVNRDTFKFAQKASAVLKTEVMSLGAHGGRFDTQWVPIFKDPISDPGKKSKAGRLMLYRSKVNGEYLTAPVGDSDVEWEQVLRPVYITGLVFNKDSLATIRERCSIK